MRKPEKTEEPAVVPARSPARRDENPAQSLREWEAFFARCQGNDQGVDGHFVDEEAA
jgi:hypothetical protein